MLLTTVSKGSSISGVCVVGVGIGIQVVVWAGIRMSTRVGAAAVGVEPPGWIWQAPRASAAIGRSSQSVRCGWPENGYEGRAERCETDTDRQRRHRRAAAGWKGSARRWLGRRFRVERWERSAASWSFMGMGQPPETASVPSPLRLDITIAQAHSIVKLFAVPRCVQDFG